MRTFLIVLLVLLVLGFFPVYSYGGIYGGGLVGLLILVFVVLLLTGQIRAD